MSTGDTNTPAVQPPASPAASAVSSPQAEVQPNQESAMTASEMQTRIADILASDEASGRTAQAQHLAFNTTMSVEEAVKILAVSAKDESNDAGAGAHLDALMDSEKHPDLSADDNTPSPSGEQNDRAAEMVSAHKQATGRQ